VAEMSVDNPFGMKADDPAGLDDILVNSGELHLALGESYKFVLRSKDVLHNFTVPQFRVKMDLVPGSTPFAWLKTIRTGRFEILCEELCGIAHFAMRGAVVVDEPAEFETWLSNWPTYSEVLSQPHPQPEVAQAQFAVCSACHGAQGEGNQMLNAPRLAGQDAWYSERQLRHFKTGWRGSNDEDAFGKQMAPMAAVLTDDTAVRNMAAYLASMPPVEVPATLLGNVDRGAKLYGTCQSCHGEGGQGIWALNAPRLQGMNDWYLKRQLQSYKDGVRGVHPVDLYGKQMTLMSGMLRSEQDINDVVAFINQL